MNTTNTLPVEQASSNHSHTTNVVHLSIAEGGWSPQAVKGRHADLLEYSTEAASLLGEEVEDDVVPRRAGLLVEVARQADEHRESCRTARLRETKDIKQRQTMIEGVFKAHEARFISIRDKAVKQVGHLLASGEVMEPQFETTWGIAHVDQASVDLEELRPHLTESALRTAVRKHQQSTGGRHITGVQFEKLPVL